MSKTWRDRILSIIIAVGLAGVGVLFGRWSNKVDETTDILKEHFKTEIKNEVKQELIQELIIKIDSKADQTELDNLKEDIKEIKEDQKYTRSKVDDIYKLMID